MTLEEFCSALGAPGRLADTGSEIGIAVLIGIGVVAVGLALLAFRRRRGAGIAAALAIGALLVGGATGLSAQPAFAAAWTEADCATEPGATDPGETDPGETDPGETDPGIEMPTAGEVCGTLVQPVSNLLWFCADAPQPPDSYCTTYPMSEFCLTPGTVDDPRFTGPEFCWLLSAVPGNTLQEQFPDAVAQCPSGGGGGGGGGAGGFGGFSAPTTDAEEPSLP